ncbi:AAA family ATPase [Paracoccus sediminicola]|uniref:nucleotide-binding protein n=1 Tax=Paracoccus sediminicola TaxID=3017783 RepID=UPI0022F08C41|nr:AAA family ATPase [Paracoccus sediminicola]WBU58737.1 AAA family ATPase [Paracoccus sediminicola]
MKTVAIISQKGGAGKTTLALHLATSSALQGRNTAIIDLDPQASAANWSDRRVAEVPVVLSAHASRLNHEIGRVRDMEGDLLIIDTAPHSDSAALEAAKTADLILVPCRPAILDIEAISNTLNLVKTTGKPIFVVMNAVAPQGSEATEAAEAIAELGVGICPVQLRQRVAFSRALISGQSAEEFEPEGKAAQEASQLHAFMCEHLHIPTRELEGNVA